MKKIISFIAGFAIASCAFSGCVDDPPNVVLKGVLPACDPSGEEQTYTPYCGTKTTVLYAHVMNYITGSSPWSSSGSSGTGSTYEPTIVNPGQIYIDGITIRCEKIDGEKAPCNGKDPIKRNMNFAIGGSGSGACLPFVVSEIAEWGDNVEVSIQVSYHDSSLISGKTGKTLLTVSSKYAPCVDEDDKDNGGSTTPTDPDNPPDNPGDKKAKGESCSTDDECQSGQCLISIYPDGEVLECA